MRSTPLRLRIALCAAAALLIASVALIESPRTRQATLQVRAQAMGDSVVSKLGAEPVEERWVETPAGASLDFSLSIDGALVVPSRVRIVTGADGRARVYGLPRSLPREAFPVMRGVEPLALARAHVDTLLGLRGPAGAARAWFRRDGAWTPGWIVRLPLASYRGEALPWVDPAPQAGSPVDLELRFDAGGTLLEARDLIVRAAVGRGSVFHPNPIVASGGSDLRDGDPVDQWQVAVDLPGLESDRMWGERVRIESGDSLRAIEPGLVFQYPSSDPRFEEVMAYYHLERGRAWLDSLGYGGFFSAPQRARVHASSLDNSWYSPMTKTLEFGDGGVDDAEDPDILVHELGHAIHDAFVPGFGEGDTRAISEGFADYLAATRAGDPCVAEWDATSYGPPCLRRVDLFLREPEDRTGDTHEDGRIWSGALWAIRVALGAPRADRIVLEGLARQTPEATFGEAAVALLDAVDGLALAEARETVQTILIERGLLPRSGQLTLVGEGQGDVPLDRFWPAVPGAHTIRFFADGGAQIGDLRLWPLRLEGAQEAIIDYRADAEGFAWSWEVRAGADAAAGAAVLGRDGELDLRWSAPPAGAPWPTGTVEVVRDGEVAIGLDLDAAFARSDLPRSFRLDPPASGMPSGGAGLVLVSTASGWSVRMSLPPNAGAEQAMRILGSPARGVARIRVDLPEGIAPRSVTIVDVSGRKVRALPWSSTGAALPEVLTWDGRDDSGRRVASGVYWIRLSLPRSSPAARILYFAR